MWKASEPQATEHPAHSGHSEPVGSAIAVGSVAAAAVVAEWEFWKDLGIGIDGEEVAVRKLEVGRAPTSVASDLR